MKFHFTIIFFTLLLFSCAEQIPPSGGLKDNTPPVPIELSPKNYTLNFKENLIEIKFDEFIKLNTNSENIIISPSIVAPKIELIGKKIKINFEENLKNNTTYIINFGNSIKDFNEGNQLSNFKYIFSTGNYIDSLQIKGSIVDAYNKEPLPNVIVGLYQTKLDSVLYKKPLYYTKTDEKGKYKIENIKEGNYYIAALEDKNLNYIFDQKTEKIAFDTNLISLKNNNIENKILSLFENDQKIKVLKIENEEPNHLIINLNKPSLDLNLTISSLDDKDEYYYSKDYKKIHYWYLNKDSIPTIIKISTDNFIDTINKVLNETTIKTFNYKITTELYKETNYITFLFPYPIENFNKNLLKINNSLEYSSEWKDNKTSLILNTSHYNDTILISTKLNCFTSFHKLQSNPLIDTLFSFKNNTSVLKLNIKTSKNLVIELYNKEIKLLQKKIVSRETLLEFKRLKQGKYFLRMYDDENNNKIWNTGNLQLKINEEKTLIFKELEMKNNFDQQIEIVL